MDDWRPDSAGVLTVEESGVVSDEALKATGAALFDLRVPESVEVIRLRMKNHAL